MELVTIVRRLLPGAEAWTEEELADATAYLDGEIAKLEAAAEPAPVPAVEPVPAVPVEVTPADAPVFTPAGETNLPPITTTTTGHQGEVDFSAPPAPAPDTPVVVEQQVAPNVEAPNPTATEFPPPPTPDSGQS